MSLTSDTHEARKLDGDTVRALTEEVDAAKKRGWQQPHLKRFFTSRGIEHAVYKAALSGGVVEREIASELAAISITGLPQWPYAPNPDDIAWHIEWLVAPARGQYDDALVEIAYATPEDAGQIRRARLFGLDELKAAMEFAVSKNIDGCNMYIGAALRLPDAPRDKRASAEDFYVATAVPIDIDRDYDATRAAMAAVCDDSCVVTTGLTPQRRSQHWTRLLEPCESELEFGHAFRSLVEHVGADMAVKDAARVMRLGGTVAFPNERKRSLGYCIELTTTTLNDAARLSDLETLKALAPGAGPSERRDYSGRPQPQGEDGITRAGILQTGKVTDGRERFFATKLLPRTIRNYQAEFGCDPSVDELFDLAFADFLEQADNADERWTCDDGVRQLKARAANTVRRLRLGRMARIGLASIDTGAGEEEARAAQAAWEAARPRQLADDVGQLARIQNETQPDDLFEVLSIADLRALPDAEWMVKDAIPRQGLGFIYGPPGSYKSFICGDLGLSLAYGLETWLDRPVKHPGSVLYVANEGAAGLKNRITAWQIKNGRQGDDTDRFRLIRKAMSFMDPKDVDRLERTVAAEVAARGAVDTVFVDTVSRVLPGADENLQKDMTVFVAACDRLRERFGATVIGVHHTNKHGEMRGSTVFLGQGDFIYRVEKDDGRKSGVLTCEKQKEAEDGWKMAFTVQEQTWSPPGKIEGVSSLTVSFGGEPAPEDHATKWPSRDVCRAILRDIDAAWQKGKPWSPHSRAQTEGRFAVRNIAHDYKLSAPLVQHMLEAWQTNDVLGFEIADKTTKSRGLRVLSWLE
jgi:hypothetical protein